MTIGMLAAGTVLFGCLVGNGGAPIRAFESVGNAGIDAAKAQLREKLKVAGDYPEQKYSIASWTELRMAMEAARQIHDRAAATPSALQAASAGLQKKIDALEERKVVPALGPRIALKASLFATERKGRVNNVALLWASADPCDSFEVHRAAGKGGNFTKLYSGQGASFNDYGLKEGTYSYKLVARREGKTLTSNVERITTMAMPAGVTEYSNQTGTGASLGEPLKVGDTHYRFDGKRDGKTVTYTVKTSTDGKTWKDGPVVLDRSSHPDLDDYKFESGTIFYDNTRDRIVWWCHWERSGPSYAHGRAFVATAKPGGRFTVHHIYNPLGIQVRDMSVFVDDDRQGYLAAASNVPGQGANATLYLFKLNADYTGVTGITNKAMEGEYREAPHIVKTGGFYYLFFSQAAGWYPSRAGYVSARTLDGRWSDVRHVGNSSTFSAQSGGIIDYGRDGDPYVPVMLANRWIRGEGTSRNVVLPLRCAEGFAFDDYAPTLLLDPAKDRILPLHAGRLLSQDRPASSSIPGSKGHEAGRAFDGDYTTSFQSDEKNWPFTVTTDLGTVCKVRNVQVSWHLHKGSEAYYKYTVEGSLDGREWRVLRDRTDDKDTTVSKTYGFSSDLLPDAPSARHVRINVHRAVLHNNPNNWYPPILYEVKVYGARAGQTAQGVTDNARTAAVPGPGARMPQAPKPRASETKSAEPAAAAAVPADFSGHPMVYRLADGHGGWPADKRRRVVEAMDAAIGLYNRLGVFPKNVTAAYSPDTPTADGNYNGNIRFGGQINRRVALHELGHVLGIGTHPRWRSLIRDRKWTGRHALAQVRAFGGPEAVLNVDGMHFWPYGLNYDRESSPENDRRHVLMVAAFRRDLGIVAGEPIRGMVGVGTWATQAEFKDIKVTRGGRTLLSSDFSRGTRGWKTLRGKWEVVGGVLRQTSEEENVRALVVGDTFEGDHTLTLKARKLGGREGFLVIFGSPGDETKSWWNLGGWGNTRHALEVPDGASTPVAGSIEPGRWYDIRVEVRGATVKAYLDGKLVQQARR